MSIRALPFVLLQGFCFAASLLASRSVVDQFHPLTYAGLQLLVASLCHVCVVVFGRRRRLPASSRLWRHAAVLGVFGTALPTLLNRFALEYLSATVIGILIATGPAITVVLAHLFLRDEPLSMAKGVGVGFALGGAVLLALRGESGLADVGHANPLGYVWILLGASLFGAMTVYARKFVQDLDPLDLASARTFVAALGVFPLSILVAGLDLGRVSAYGYVLGGLSAVAGMFGGMTLTFYNAQRFGATATAMAEYVIPVIVALGGTLLLNERITWGMTVGTGLIATGLLLINWKASGVSSSHQQPLRGEEIRGRLT